MHLNRPQTGQRGIARAPGKRLSQSGVALAIVVWFIAGMSLLVAGIVSLARVDTQMAQLHVARAKVSAAGDGAISLAMAELNATSNSGAVKRRNSASSYRLGELEVVVTLVPTSGLINLNVAPHPLYMALFSIAAGMGEEEAQRLADSVIDWRKGVLGRDGRKYRRSKFNEPEDLLRVEGVNRTLLDAVRDYIVAGNAARGGLDWQQAPGPVLAVLEKSDGRERGALQQQRDKMAAAQSGGSRPDAGARAYRADARVQYGGRTWLRRRWVLREPSIDSALPWRMVRTESARVVE
jgi:general secretion pathway protein K